MEVIQSNLDIIFRSANLTFQEAFTKTPTWYQKIAMTLNVGGSSVTYGWMDRLPVMRKWLGNRQINAVSTQQKTVTHQLYEQTFGLRKVDVEDDQLGLFNAGVRMQGAAVAKWPDVEFASLFGILASATYLGYDGVPVYSASHPLLGGNVAGNLDGVVQSNLFLNRTLSYDNYIFVRTAMMSLNGADGQPLGITPNLLVVPPQLEGVGKLILEADFLPAAAVSAQTNVYKGTAQLLVVPQLANKPNNWYLMDTTQVIMPFIWQLRQAPNFVYKTNPTDDNVFLANQFLYGVDARAVPTESIWQLSAAGTSAGAY